MHCLSVFSGDFGSPLLLSLTKNLSLCVRKERQRTHSEMNCGAVGGRERSENKVSRMSSAAERRGQQGETPSKYQVQSCLREGWAVGSGRQNCDVSIASDYRSIAQPDEIFKASHLPDNLVDPDRTASAKNVGASWRTHGGQQHSVVTCCQRQWRGGGYLLWHDVKLAASPLFNSKRTWSNEVQVTSFEGGEGGQGLCVQVTVAHRHAQEVEGRVKDATI